MNLPKKPFVASANALLHCGLTERACSLGGECLWSRALGLLDRSLLTCSVFPKNVFVATVFDDLLFARNFDARPLCLSWRGLWYGHFDAPVHHDVLVVLSRALSSGLGLRRSFERLLHSGDLDLVGLFDLVSPSQSPLQAATRAQRLGRLKLYHLVLRTLCFAPAGGRDPLLQRTR